MRAGGVLSGRDGGESLPGAVADHRHSDSQKAGRTVWRRSAVKPFAVRTNLWDWKPKRLLVWHREKAGTIEAVHDVLKNELAGGVLPCGRYGANAAWFRLAVITYNVLTARQIDETTTVVCYPPPFIADDSSSHHQLP